MGEKVYPPPDFYPPGPDCYACTPTLYESGTWPSRLYATFTGISPCPLYSDPPNDHVFQLKCGVAGCGYTCRETYAGSTYYVSLNLVISQLYLIREAPIAGSVFYDEQPMCSLIFPSNMLACPPHAAEGGSAIVTATPTPLLSYLCGSCHLTPWNLTLAEQKQVAMDHTLVRLANKQDHTCVYVYIDDEDLPQ